MNSSWRWTWEAEFRLFQQCTHFETVQWPWPIQTWIVIITLGYIDLLYSSRMKKRMHECFLFWKIFLQHRTSINLMESLPVMNNSWTTPYLSPFIRQRGTTWMMDFERSWQSCIDSCYLQMPQYWICVPNTIRIYRQRFAALGTRKIDLEFFFGKWSFSNWDYSRPWNTAEPSNWISYDCFMFWHISLLPCRASHLVIPGQLLLDGARYEPIGTHGQLTGLAALHPKLQRGSQFTWAFRGILWCGCLAWKIWRCLRDVNCPEN